MASRVLLRSGASVLCAVVLASLAASADARPAEEANPFTTTATQRAGIHFVPLDPRARTLLTATLPNVTRYLHHPYNVTAIPSAPMAWVNRERQQLNGRAVMTDLMARFRSAHGDRQDFVVIVTTLPMYDRQFPELAFVFGSRAVASQGLTPATVAIATAQMRVYHPEREKARLTKMMLRYIGEVICRLPRNSNPKSVLYTPLNSDAELDRMTAALPSRC